MNNLKFEAVKQMAATCSALQMLLSGDREIRDLQIFGGTSFPEAHCAKVGTAAKQGRSTLIVTFNCDGPEALVDKMLFFNASSKKKQTVSISFCSFVKSEDGKFALRLAGREQPIEHVFSRSSNRLICRPVKDDTARAIAELNGLQALLAKAAMPECQERSFQVG